MEGEGEEEVGGGSWDQKPDLQVRVGVNEGRGPDS